MSRSRPRTLGRPRRYPRSGTTQRVRDADCCTVGCLQPAVETTAGLAGPQHTRQVQRQAVGSLLRVTSPAPRALCQPAGALPCAPCRARHAARSRQHHCVALNPIRCSQKITRSTRVKGVSVRNTPALLHSCTALSCSHRPWLWSRGLSFFRLDKCGKGMETGVLLLPPRFT